MVRNTELGRQNSLGRAGTLRLYDRTAVEMVRDELHKMDQRQGVGR